MKIDSSVAGETKPAAEFPVTARPWIVSRCRLLPQRLQCDLRLQRRIDLPSRLLHSRSVYDSGTAPNPISQPIPNPGSTPAIGFWYCPAMFIPPIQSD